jgi:hypothetical protein
MTILENIFSRKDIIIKIYTNKIGYRFATPRMKVLTFLFGTTLTTIACVKCTIKAVASPNKKRWCKVLYVTAAGLHIISIILTSLALLSGYSYIAPVPLFFGSLALGINIGAKGCNLMGDCASRRQTK